VIDNEVPRNCKGMTLLEHYAGLAMQGICVNAGRDWLERYRPEIEAAKMAAFRLEDRA